MLQFALPNIAALMCFLRMHANNFCPTITSENGKLVISNPSAGFSILMNKSLSLYHLNYITEIMCNATGRLDKPMITSGKRNAVTGKSKTAYTSIDSGTANIKTTHNSLSSDAETAINKTTNTSMNSADTGSTNTKIAHTSMNSADVETTNTKTTLNSMISADAGTANTKTAYTSMNSAVVGTANTTIAHTSKNNADVGTAYTKIAKTSMNSANVGTAITTIEHTSKNNADVGTAYTKMAKTSVNSANVGNANTTIEHTSKNNADVGTAYTKIAKTSMNSANVGTANTTTAQTSMNSTDVGTAYNNTTHTSVKIENATSSNAMIERTSMSTNVQTYTAINVATTDKNVMTTTHYCSSPEPEPKLVLQEKITSSVTSCDGTCEAVGMKCNFNGIENIPLEEMKLKIKHILPHIVCSDSDPDDPSTLTIYGSYKYFNINSNVHPSYTYIKRCTSGYTRFGGTYGIPKCTWNGTLNRARICNCKC